MHKQYTHTAIAECTTVYNIRIISYFPFYNNNYNIINITNRDSMNKSVKYTIQHSMGLQTNN